MVLSARFSNVFTIDICIEFNIDIDIDIDIAYIIIMISVFAFLISLSRMCSLLIYVLNLILILILILILNMSSSMLKKKAASISQLATLNRFNVLQVHLVRVFLEQVLPHAKKNLASRNKPDCVIWLHMHVFHRILEQGC